MMMSDDNDKNNVINVGFNPSVQTEADKIDIDIAAITRRYHELVGGSDKVEEKLIKHFLDRGDDQFTARRKARDIVKKGRN